MDEKPSTLGIVPDNYIPTASNPNRQKRVFTNQTATCQLMLDSGGGLFEFPLPPESTPVVVGRKKDHTDNYINVNLAPFDGFSLGVSRTHANFERAGSRLFLRDLGSTNGTWLNGERLTANHVNEVCHGDHIEFGRLSTKLFIK